MIAFSYHAARTEREALSAASSGARYIAGGTTLVDLMREEVERPHSLIDINQLPLRNIRLEADSLVIGALARMADTAAHPVVAREHPLIVEALLEGASPQLRNMASIGGNLMQRVRCPYFRTLDAPSSLDRAARLSTASTTTMPSSAPVNIASRHIPRIWRLPWSRWTRSFACAAIQVHASFQLKTFIVYRATHRTSSIRSRRTS